MLAPGYVRDAFFKSWRPARGEIPFVVGTIKNIGAIHLEVFYWPGGDKLYALVVAGGGEVREFAGEYDGVIDSLSMALAEVLFEG